MTPLLIATQAYAHLAAALVGHGLVAAEVERTTFPDGERYQRLITPVAGRSVVILGGTISDEDTLAIFDLACAAVKYGASALTLVVPYFGYATMERAVKPGEVVTAKCRARLLSAIPAAPAGNRVILVDLHADGIPHYFEGGVRPMHVYAKPVVLELIRRFGGSEFTLACTDAGRAKWVQSLANEIGVPAAFIFKRRIDGSQTEVAAVSAQVEGRTVVLYDDMIRTGGSLINAARAYRAAGARRIAAVCTHGVLPGDAFGRLRATGLFDAIAATDSHPRALALQQEGLQVVSIAGIIAEAINQG